MKVIQESQVKTKHRCDLPPVGMYGPDEAYPIGTVIECECGRQYKAKWRGGFIGSEWRRVWFRRSVLNETEGA